MAEKRFAGADGMIETPEVSKDYENAAVFEKLRVGELGVYFRDGLRTRFIAYNRMDRAFIRIQETHSRMCCGQANFNYFRVVFVVDGKEYANYMSEKEKLMDDALEAITAHGVATGFVREEVPAEACPADPA